jgi:hypothetical protein
MVEELHRGEGVQFCSPFVIRCILHRSNASSVLGVVSHMHSASGSAFFCLHRAVEVSLSTHKNTFALRLLDYVFFKFAFFYSMKSFFRTQVNMYFIKRKTRYK